MDRCMTTKEAAAKAGVSMRRARQFATQRGLPLFGSEPMWTEEDVKRMEARKGQVGRPKKGTGVK